MAWYTISLHPVARMIEATLTPCMTSIPIFNLSPFCFMRNEVSIVVTELFTTHLYRPKAKVSFAATLITSSLSLVVEMTLPFLTHEILLIGG